MNRALDLSFKQKQIPFLPKKKCFSSNFESDLAEFKSVYVVDVLEMGRKWKRIWKKVMCLVFASMRHVCENCVTIMLLLFHYTAKHNYFFAFEHIAFTLIFHNYIYLHGFFLLIYLFVRWKIDLTYGDFSSH